MLTPTWMKIDYCRNLIYIEGTPKYQDIGKMLIRCINQNGYIIKQYKLKIIDFQKENASISVIE